YGGGYGPYIMRCNHAFDLGPPGLGNGQPRIIAAMCGNRPAAIAATPDDVDLVAATRPVLAQQSLARAGIQRRALRIAMTVAPDFRPRAGCPGKRVVVGYAAIGMQTHQLALMLVEILRRCTLVVLAQSNDQVACPVEHQPRAKMVARRKL